MSCLHPPGSLSVCIESIQEPVGSGPKITQALLPHRFGRRFLRNVVLARAAISFQLVTHHLHHDLAGERSGPPHRSSPPCCRSGSTLLPRQRALVCVAEPTAIEHGPLAGRSEATAAAVHCGSGGVGSRQECTEADLGHFPDSTSGRHRATGKPPSYYTGLSLIAKHSLNGTATDSPQHHPLSSQGAQHCPPPSDPQSLSPASHAQSPSLPFPRAHSCPCAARRIRDCLCQCERCPKGGRRSRAINRRGRIRARPGWSHCGLGARPAAATAEASLPLPDYRNHRSSLDERRCIGRWRAFSWE